MPKNKRAPNYLENFRSFWGIPTKVYMIALKVRKLFFFVQVAGKGGAASTIEAGIRATAQLLGEDVGKEVNINQFVMSISSNC